MKNKIFKRLLLTLMTIVLLISAYFLFMTLTDYKPNEVISLSPDSKSSLQIKSDKTFKATIFNIGYATLDKDADFFMDGGRESKAKNSDVVYNNLNGIVDFFETVASDFYLLQEVDIKAMRSRGVNQYAYLNDYLDTYESVFAMNYKVPWVPVPLTDPMGSVTSGIVNFSKYSSDELNRYQFPGQEAWPRQLALLDRCFIESRYHLDNGTDLVIINLHMSAYDSGGFMRAQQVEYLQSYLKTNYEAGDYIIVGGDFNHEIPGTDADDFNEGPKPSWLKVMDAEFIGMEWHIDPSIPTNRSLDQAYEKGHNYLTIIDGFIVSDNITVLKTIVHDLEFKHSDHNPVTIEFKLNE